MLLTPPLELKKKISRVVLQTLGEAEGGRIFEAQTTKQVNR